MGKLDIGTWQQNCPGQNVCGDRYFTQQAEKTLTVAVIDGLGHGEAAAHAADKAVKVLESTAAGLSESIPMIHKELLGTRGVVLGIARINCDTGKINYIGIGNIYTYVVYRDHVRMLVTAEGFLGYRLPKFHEHLLEMENVQQLIMVSDGIATMPGKELFKMGWRNAADIAQSIGKKWGMHNDDETVVVVKKREI